MRLFLCEKPLQAKAIGKVLGVLDGRYDGYYQKGDTAVTWAFGHILTQAMPDAYGEAYADFGNIESLPILPQQWKMEVSSKTAKQFKAIKGLLAKTDEVVIATDADREGEVIAREILEYCGYRKKVSRFWTSSLDTASVKKALAAIRPGKQTETLYQAGLARNRADWLVGMNLSRAYTVAYASGFGKEHTLSIGRIQTPTLNLVVRRDSIIDTFQPYPYYGLSVDFQTASQEVFTAYWQIPESLQNKDGLCVDKAFVVALAKQLETATGIVSVAKTERKNTPAPLPYSLSALQKEASKRFGLSSSKVLQIAQKLYEEYKITSYPRTPCRYLPKSQQQEVSGVFAAMAAIDGSLAPVLAKADPNRPSRVWNDAQVNKHSHHAIIPTLTATFDMSVLDKNEREIYLMIRSRYIAQFYPEYEYDATVIMVESCSQIFKATGQRPRVQGWRTLLGKTDEESAEEDTVLLPTISVGNVLAVFGCKTENKKTAPPPRFTEATLLDEMEKLSDYLKEVDDEQIKKVLRSTQGLGTEATRAAIIDRLFEMGYMKKQKGKIFSTEKGRNLIAQIPAIVADPVTTAKWELALAGIESGKLTMEDFMAYQEDLIRQLVDQAKADAVKRPKAAKPAASAQPKNIAKHKAGDTCPDCGGTLQEKTLKNAPEKKYLGCSKYPECKHFEWVQ